MAGVWKWRNELTPMTALVRIHDLYLVCGDVLDTNQLQTPEFRLLVMYARLGVFPAINTVYFRLNFFP